MNIYVIEPKKNEDGELMSHQYHDELASYYKKQILSHNKKFEDQTNYNDLKHQLYSKEKKPTIYADSGFDLFIPPAPPHKESQEAKGWVNYRGSWYIKPRTTVKVPLGIKLTKTGMFSNTQKISANGFTQPYYVYPRSSIYKTPLRLANCTGIIDAGYRGELMAVFDNISDEGYELKPYTRLLQACSPDLRPFTVEVMKEDFDTTTRGEGGLGSTGT